VSAQFAQRQNNPKGIVKVVSSTGANNSFDRN